VNAAAAARSRCYISLGERGALHMAWDAALLEIADAAPCGAVLRLYSWTPPAISLGRFQDLARAVDVERAAAAGIDVVRRPTGGRAVLHDGDLTYALVARHDDPVFGGTRFASQRAIGKALALGLGMLGVRADLAPGDPAPAEIARGAAARVPRAVPPCFSTAAREELRAGGRKLLGSARVEARGAFLQHGSLPLARGPSAIARFLPGDDAARAAAEARLGAHALSLSEAAGRAITLESACDAVRRGFDEYARREFRVAEPEARERALAERLAPRFVLAISGSRAPEASVC